MGEEQASKAEPSREHSKVEPSSVEEKAKLAEALLVVPDGPEEPRAVSGGVVSGGVT